MWCVRVVGRVEGRVGVVGGLQCDFRRCEVAKIKRFKVAAVSSNANSFGLKGVVVIAKNGEAFEVGANTLSMPKEGQVLGVPVEGGSLNWARLGFEIPRELERAPRKVVKQVWAAA